jgi:hypothetical protein
MWEWSVASEDCEKKRSLPGLSSWLVIVSMYLFILSSLFLCLTLEQLLLKGHQSYLVKVHSNELPLTFLPLQRPCLPITSHSETLGLKWYLSHDTFYCSSLCCMWFHLTVSQVILCMWNSFQCFLSLVNFYQMCPSQKLCPL